MALERGARPTDDDWPGDRDVFAEAQVRAAGGVIVRRDGKGGALELALIHRPKYDDWSLPKGKLDAGEGWEEAALREVEEETGLCCRLLHELEPVAYRDPKDRRKVVRYWVMEPVSGTFEPSSEVDRFEWVAIEEGLDRLTYPHDSELVRAAVGRAAPPAGVELERKWIVRERPESELDDAPADRIQQGYLAVGGETEPEVRLRRRGERTLLTIKSAGGLERIEEEIELDERTFDALWPLTEGRRIEKTRHLIAHGERTIELDVYEGDLDGLVVAEVEFASKAASRAFDPPPWLGEDVTEDGRYKNRNLAVDGPPPR
jgi:CYTH domain-containing protein/predicted NUDIX family NTP pyrophosphohydrolase